MVKIINKGKEYEISPSMHTEVSIALKLHMMRLERDIKEMENKHHIYADYTPSTLEILLKNHKIELKELKKFERIFKW